MKMERISQGENILHGYVAQRSFESPSSLPRTPFRSSDVDFNDVFGGPPRRCSLHETRCSSDGAMDPEETVSLHSLSSEKPVFGEESSVNRRKHLSNDFFGDIFQGDKPCSSPRRDFINSLPCSRVMSPARSLPPKAGTSLLTHFSLPATLNKAMEYPLFASSSSFKMKEGTSNGVSYPNSSLSRFSSQAIQGQDEFKNDVWPSNCQSPLSHEFSLSKEKSSYMTKSNETDIRGNSKDNSKRTEAPSDINQFHFSIYKWAGRGVPIVMPLRAGRIKSDTILLPANAYDKDTHSISANSESSGMEGQKVDKTSTLIRAETCQMVEEGVLKKPKPKTLGSTHFTVENFLDDPMLLSNKIEETKPCSLPEISLSEKTEKEVSMVTEEAREPEVKPLRSLLYDEIEGLGNEEIIMKAEGKENVAKTTKMSHSNVAASKNVKKHDGKRINSTKTEGNKVIIQGSPKNSGSNLRRSGVRGKVREIVKIFNQDKSNACTQSPTCKWEPKVTSSNPKSNEASVITTGIDTEMHLPNVNKRPDASFVVDENVEQLEKHHSHMKSTIHTSTDHSFGQNETSPFSESIPNGSKFTHGDIDDPFQENYLIKELSDDPVKLPQISEDYEALDTKILQWSNGKKGNIRSLLSTLQYVLWAESGWKPVPLVNIIEGNAVKRAYQKALLCLHPDKLQQKCAASHQKYIAEKVFDILQEAWDHFNSLGSI